jgi:hypothetical protein
MERRLSFPPDASWLPAAFHVSPQTSCAWDRIVEIAWLAILPSWGEGLGCRSVGGHRRNVHLTSWFTTVVSLLPLLRRWSFQAREPTL